MATYKVPQNVEAEDKLLGPFSFKQFIYLMIASSGVFMTWLFFHVHTGWLSITTIPLVIVFAILGIYHRADQPVETYLLAAISFLTKPRKRKWDPEGIVENVRITAPKKIVQPTAKHLERGQLERLAHIVDTRGWYLKRPELQEPMRESLLEDDDRLINPSAQITQEPIDVHMTDDMLSPTNPALDDYTALARGSHEQARQHAIAHMREAQKLETGNPAYRQAGLKMGDGQTASGPQLPVTNPQLPTSVHYNPYPTSMEQHLLDPVSGHYGMAANDKSVHPAAGTEARLRQLSNKASVHEVAKAVNRPTSEAPAGKSFHVAKGGTASLRHQSNV